MATVKIYSTPSCVYCKLAKEFFDEHGVKYTDLNVAEDYDARAEMIDRSGQMGVPVIFIDNEMTIGFDEERIRSLLNL
ncbi:NrdH-redoxin [Candidatus Azambacteria bacterium]|nr:NrdH-redoxin [Candidatus Azambacteria bacterium]